MHEKAQAWGGRASRFDATQAPAPKQTWLARFGQAFADLLFPPHCVVCKTLGAWLCVSCQAAIETIRPPLCDRCGLPLTAATGQDVVAPGPRPGRYHRCGLADSSLVGARAFALYEGVLREAIHAFKYEGLQALSGQLGEMMADGWAVLASHRARIDVVVPVPLHPLRMRERGFNQAALLARQLGARLRVPVVEDVLVRARPTAPQVALDPEQRQANVAGAFRCVDGRLTGTHVLLIDDVRTTGSTLEAACAALHQAGSASVWAYTLACATSESRGSPADSETGSRRV